MRREALPGRKDNRTTGSLGRPMLKEFISHLRSCKKERGAFTETFRGETHAIRSAKSRGSSAWDQCQGNSRLVRG